jgi:hypothetical protein
MVNGQRGGSRAGFVVVSLLALGAIEACGSRSPLVEDFGQGFAGQAEETGGSGGSVGGALGGGTGGDGYGGVGGDYTPGTGGYPGVGGAYGGVGGTYGGVGGDYPGVGGAYQTGGAGGSVPNPAGGVGGVYATGGVGGKGMGAGGKGMGVGGANPMGGKGGGGPGDPRVHKGCVIVCDQYQTQCPEVAGECLTSCLGFAQLYPQCARSFGDYLTCLRDQLDRGALCDPETCSGPGCMSEAQESCQYAIDDFTVCISPDPDPECYANGEASPAACRITTYCGDTTYDTNCYAVDATLTSYECTCRTTDTVGLTHLDGYDSLNACYEMERQCGFPQLLNPSEAPPK